MKVTRTTRIELYKYIIKFADEHKDLRIILGRSGEVQFNLLTTGATIGPDIDTQNPTLEDLLKLPLKDNGLFFDFIHFRKGDGGPGLANIKLENGRFGHTFTTATDERVILFCNALNTALRNPAGLKDTIPKSQFTSIIEGYKPTSFLGFLGVWGIFPCISPVRSPTIEQLKSLSQGPGNQIHRKEVEQVLARTGQTYKLQMFDQDQATDGTGRDEVLCKLSNAFSS